MADNFTPSNISYTNKDFQSIYNELLELIPKLTNKWDPSLSNESDPLVVLLKLNALLADKNNYNIDKNILELFPVSVTQRGNAQKIYESLGYSMAWYRSAITEVAFRWVGTTSNDITEAIKIFDMITDASGEVVYTLIPEDGRENISIDKSGAQDTKVLAMEGTCNDYTLNGSDIITLDNLDADLRLYFTDSRIAENGIFIANAPSDTTSADWKEHLTWLDWVAVDNLEATDLGQKVYKFGVLPNSNTCYIQFPQDIANLISQGLVIKYLISSGSAGTIKAKTLDSLFSDITETSDNTQVVINDNIRLWNPSDSTAGQDPESLDDAYRNYKKLVTTFNTLVTCKDYESAIYRLTDDNDLPIVSNVIVSDRSNDYIQGTTLVKASSPSGNYDYVYHQENFKPFDIKFYVLKPANTINTAAQYNDSFNTDAKIVKEVSDTLDISDYKSAQHNIKTPSNQSPFIYKAKYTIKCKLTTYNKVSQNQAKSICSDVELALYRKYNARNIDFGEAISYDSIIDTIKSANKVIKDVILNDIDYNVVSMNSDNVETSIAIGSPAEAENIKVKNILAGRSQGLKFNTEFSYNLEQSNGVIYPRDTSKQIKAISGITTVKIGDYPDCLTFTGETSEFTLSAKYKEWDGTLYYSTDHNTWSVWDGTAISSANKKLYLKGKGNTTFWTSNGARLSLSAKAGCNGNMQTLLDWENPPTGITAVDCYNAMFNGCANLTTPPALPATTLAGDCYSNMFEGCSDLIKAPELPATTLANYCYSSMFSGCTSLTSAPSLPATTLADGCYKDMFSGCSNLKLSTTKTTEYKTAWRIPSSGTISSEPTGWNTNMLANTGSTFTDALSINTTYYGAWDSSSDDSTYTIKDNEIVTLFGASYKPVVTYSTYLYYEFSSDIKLKTPSDSYYQLGEHQFFTIGKENINNTIQTDAVKYSKGTIFKLSGFTKIEGGSIESLGSNKTITIYEPNEITIPKVTGNIKCYWITNNPQNTLFDFEDSNKVERYLYEGEYFIYINSEQTEVSILGAGTLLTAERTTADVFPTLSKTASSVDVTDIGVSSINWVSVPSSISIKAQENQIINLTSPVKLACLEGLDLSGSKNHKEVAIPTSFRYNDNKLPQLPDEQSWKGISRLKVVGDTNTSMKLYKDQSLELKYNDSNSDTIKGIDSGKNILFNQPVALQAGDNVDAGSLLSNGDIEYSLKLYTYDNNASGEPAQKIDGYNVYPIEANTDKKITINPIPGYNYMFKAYWLTDTSADLNLSTTGKIKISNYASNEPTTNETITISPYTAENRGPIYCISFLADSDAISDEGSLTFSSTGMGNLYISNLLIFKTPGDELEDIIDIIRKQPDDIKQRFDFTYQVPDTDLIENPTLGENLLDPNNIMSKFTIAQINTDTLDISVSKSSLL